MHEVEVKILEIDPAEIRKRLKKAGAVKIFENKEIHAKMYDFPDRRIRKKGNLMRLREIAGYSEFTFKKKISKKTAKDFEETDAVVDDFRSAGKILEMLGLKCYREYRKKRSRYRIGNFQYEIDKYPGIPYFAEVEVKSKDRKKALKMLEKAVKIIGYSISDSKPWSSSDVFRHYNKKF